MSDSLQYPPREEGTVWERIEIIDREIIKAKEALRGLTGLRAKMYLEFLKER